MDCRSSARSEVRSRQTLICGLIAIFALSATGPEALALPPEDPSSRPPLKTVPMPTDFLRTPTWVGEHVAVDVGLTAASGAYSGAALSVGGRVATLLQIVDAEARVQFGAAGEGARLGVSAQLNLHPAFIALVWRNFWGVLASGFHGYLGVGIIRFSGTTGGIALPLAIGLGVDVPLMSLERSSGLWLTARTGWRWMTVDAGDVIQDGDDSHATVCLGWRWYDKLR